MCITIGNQFEILMLIEMLEEVGIHIISANTDGIVCLFDKTKETLYYEICHKWEKIVGNDVRGKLEYTDYEKLVQMSVNDYIAYKPYNPDYPQTVDERVKTKGDFLIDFELHKNKSNRVRNLALMNYFIRNINPKDFITRHNNIYDFCACVRAKGNAVLVQEGMVNGEVRTEKLQKTVRYYSSKKGSKILKRDPTDGRQWQVDAGRWMQTVFNQYVEKPMAEYDIDYDYYIEQTYNIINQIIPEVSLRSTQLTMQF